MMSFVSSWFGPAGQEPSPAQVKILTDLKAKLNTPVGDSAPHEGL